MSCSDGAGARGIYADGNAARSITGGHQAMTTGEKPMEMDQTLKKIRLTAETRRGLATLATAWRTSERLKEMQREEESGKVKGAKARRRLNEAAAAVAWITQQNG